MTTVKGAQLLASACKEGTLKLWDVTNTRRMTLVEEVRPGFRSGKGCDSKKYRFIEI